MKKNPSRTLLCLLTTWLMASVIFSTTALAAERELCAVIGLPDGESASYVTDMATTNTSLYYFQSTNAATVAAVRADADAAGLLGNRIFVDMGSFTNIHLAGSLVSRAMVAEEASGISTQELLRILHPNGVAQGTTNLTKAFPTGVDFWTHPLHGPGNNPLSTDQVAKAPYATQFISDPKYVPMPNVTVTAGKYMFRLSGNMVTKTKQLPYVNKLICFNAYNGMKLWTRDLTEGFMINRNTLVATPTNLFFADDTSCKVIDNETGTVIREIQVPGNAVWKWMGMEDGVLYALVGGSEANSPTWGSVKDGIGGWHWATWQGYDYSDPDTNFGFGKTLVAINPDTSAILWSNTYATAQDSRGICLQNGKLFICNPEVSVTCLDTADGSQLWQNTNSVTLDAIGPNQAAQTAITGFSTTPYAKCNDNYLLISGPQRRSTTCLSATDGTFKWVSYNPDDLEYHGQSGHYGSAGTLLKGSEVYLVNETRVGENMKIHAETGATNVMSDWPTKKSCATLTGNEDSLFYRIKEGTLRIDTPSDSPKHLAPMRPSCNDGTITSGGQLYWGPMICACEISLLGQISLGHRDTNLLVTARLELNPDGTDAQPFPLGTGDWPLYQKNSQRSCVVDSIPDELLNRTETIVSASNLLTAPVVVNHTIFTGSRNGAVTATRTKDGVQLWKSYTAGDVFYPPEFWNGRVYAGSADGKLYCFEAATGELLWRFHIAPQQRYIPVYESLMSTWPLMCGVLAEDGVVYAVGGLSSYDSIHVYALNAETGAQIWSQEIDKISQTTENGFTPSGHLYLDGNELCFTGGNVYKTARFNKTTGALLNSAYNIFKAPYYGSISYSLNPEYAYGQMINHSLTNGKTLYYFINYDGIGETALALINGAPPNPSFGRGMPSIDLGDTTWENSDISKITAYAVSDETLLVAGTDAGTDDSLLVAYNIDDGVEIWSETLSAPVVKGGLAIDQDRDITVVQTDGKIVTFQSEALDIVPTEVTVPEGGSGTFNLRLATEPVGATTVTVTHASGDSDLSVTGGASLTFTPADWATYQTVTVSAVQDGDFLNGSAIFNCAAASLGATATVTATESDDDENPAYSIPWSETFDDRTLAGIDGQNGWTGAGTVQTGTVYEGTQALSLTGETASHTFLGNPTNIWITFWMKPTLSERPPDTIPAGASAVFYVNTNRHLVAYSNSTEIVIESPEFSNGWNKIALSCDFVSKVWNLELNDVPMVGNFPFHGNPASFQALELTEGSTNSAFFDSITLSDTSDESDEDADGIPDSWEIQYYGSTNVNPSAMASNGVNTVLETYIAGLNPTNPQSTFLISDLNPLTSGTVLSWNTTNGRLYSVYWASNLLSGFQPLESNIAYTALPYTDTNHTDEVKGFYKIEVELE